LFGDVVAVEFDQDGVSAIFECRMRRGTNATEHIEHHTRDHIGVALAGWLPA